MDITHQEVIEMASLLLIAFTIGGLWGLIALRKGKFSLSALAIAPLLANLIVIVGLVIVDALESSHQSSNLLPILVQSIARGLLFTLGICIICTLPACLGCALFQWLNVWLKRRTHCSNKYRLIRSQFPNLEDHKEKPGDEPGFILGASPFPSLHFGFTIPPSKCLFVRQLNHKPWR